MKKSDFRRFKLEFERLAKIFDKDIEPDVLEDYFNLLGCYSFAAVQKAMTRAKIELSFFPRLRELSGLCKECEDLLRERIEPPSDPFFYMTTDEKEEARKREEEAKKEIEQKMSETGQTFQEASFEIIKKKLGTWRFGHDKHHTRH